jgi:ATP-binding cassette, subfamily B, bacterial
MTAVTEQPADGAWATLVRGLRLSPELRDGLGITLLIALVATAGRVIAPIAVQLTIDRGLQAPGGIRTDLVALFVAASLLALLVTSFAAYHMNVRLVTATETALSALRVRTFSHVHDLSIAHQGAEHRGALVSRVTSDIDQISRFMQWGGLMLVVNLGQLLLATAVMLVYSWQLALVVVITIAPLGVILRSFQRRLTRAYQVVRQRVGTTLSTISESLMGAEVIRAYGIEERTDARVDAAIDEQFRTSYRAGRLSALMFSTGEIFPGVAIAGAVALGVVLGAGGDLTVGQLVAFMFLVNLFVGPVQIATEVLDQVQTAIAGWRRVLDVLDIPADVADPATRTAPAKPRRLPELDGEGSDGVDVPPGPVSVAFHGVDFAYPERGTGALGPRVLHDVQLRIQPRTRVAVVGETGSGKTTFARLLTRLADPTAGEITINGVPLRDVRFASLRHRVVMVPQDDFLFDTTVAENVRYGRVSATDTEIAGAFVELGLGDWLATLADGLHTRVGERGNALSVGERQLVALARAYVANPDLLVLDEATSAVDPATEVRLQRALDGLAEGRTAVAIAHRLSTAEAADEIIVFDAGRVVQRGTHADLVTVPGVYRRLHESWAAQRRDAV